MAYPHTVDPLGAFEPTKPIAEMTDDELDAFAEAVYDHMVDQLDQRVADDD